MSDPKPAGQGGGKKEKPELIKTLDGSPPKEPDAGDTPKGPKPDKPELLPNPYPGHDTPPKTDIDISKLPPLNDKRLKDDKTPDDEDDILGGGPRGPSGDKGGPEVLAVASSTAASGVGARPTGESFSLNYEEISFDDMSGRPHALGAVDAVDGLPADASDSLNFEEIKVSIVAPETDQLGNFEIQDATAPEPAQPDGWSGSDGDD